MLRGLRASLHHCHTRPLSSSALMSAPWSRLVRFKDANGAERLGQPTDEGQDVGMAMYKGEKVQAKVIEGTIFDGKLTNDVVEIKELLSPVSRKELGSILCIGLNYSDHAQEAKLTLPKIPISFMKPGTALAGPHPQPIIIHKCCHPPDAPDQADYEGELCVVIGKTGKDIPKDKALEHVLGYTSSNDVSARHWQFTTSQWTHSKSFDGSAPIGPVLVHRSQISNPEDLSLRTILNDTVRQDGTTKNLVFGVADLVSFLSQGTTIEAGTIILTGTPAGVGTFFKPTVTLKDGDVCIVEIGGGIGSLVNEVKWE